MAAIKNFIQEVCEWWEAGFTVDQIAKALDISVETVRKVISQQYDRESR